jgi:hypothetical protein
MGSLSFWADILSIVGFVLTFFVAVTALQINKRIQRTLLRVKFSSLIPSVQHALAAAKREDLETLQERLTDLLFSMDEVLSLVTATQAYHRMGTSANDLKRVRTNLKHMLSDLATANLSDKVNYNPFLQNLQDIVSVISQATAQVPIHGKV